MYVGSVCLHRCSVQCGVSWAAPHSIPSNRTGRQAKQGSMCNLCCFYSFSCVLAHYLHDFQYLVNATWPFSYLFNIWNYLCSHLFLDIPQRVHSGQTQAALAHHKCTCHIFCERLPEWRPPWLSQPNLMLFCTSKLVKSYKRSSVITQGVSHETFRLV